MGLAVLRMGTIYECGADMEDAERCLHVLTMSLEALSANSNVAGTWKHISKAVHELTCGSLGLVSHGSESDVDLFPTGAANSSHLA